MMCAAGIDLDLELDLPADLPASPGKPRVVVAMSGGVDSSVAAALVVEAGYDAIGVTLQLYDHGAAVQRRGACCAGQDIHDARNVADKLGIPHYVLDYESRFRESVMDDFADSYLRGETPIPCVRCNQTVKFHDLLGVARDLGAAALCTGHYVRRLRDSAGNVALCRGVDPAKDQSYFLFATTPAQLDFLRFPLGGFTKQETRDLARKFGLFLAEKPDSQDICFVPNGRYSDVVQKLRPGAIDPGEIVDLNGRVLGKHQGIINFTIGQRKGLGLGGIGGGIRGSEKGAGADAAALYVIAIDPETRRVIVGPHAALACDKVKVTALNWLADSVYRTDSDENLQKPAKTCKTRKNPDIKPKKEGAASTPAHTPVNHTSVPTPDGPAARGAHTRIRTGAVAADHTGLLAGAVAGDHTDILAGAESSPHTNPLTSPLGSPDESPQILAHTGVRPESHTEAHPADHTRAPAIPVLVKLRSTHAAVPAVLFPEADGTSALVQLEVPEFGISPGQAAVFYDPETGTRVLGGGWIASTERSDAAGDARGEAPEEAPEEAEPEAARSSF